MREIKFRAWDEKSKRMFNVDVLAISPVMWDSGGTGVSLAYQPHIKVMQYTGLKDKNDKEIYEGDIIDGKFTDIGVDTGLVVFKGYGFKLEIPSVGDDDLVDWERNCESIEVIGNIYENPELLEGTV